MNDAPATMPATYPAVRDFLDRHVLCYLYDASPRYSDHDFWAFTLAAFTNEWIGKEVARGICRDLRSRGLIQYHRGLFDEDGIPAGSGYAITEAGRKYVKENVPGYAPQDPVDK